MALNKVDSLVEIEERYWEKYKDEDIETISKNEYLKEEIQKDLDKMYEALDRLSEFALPKGTAFEEAWLLKTGVAKRGAENALYIDVDTKSKTKDLWKLSTTEVIELCSGDVEGARVKQAKEVIEVNEEIDRESKETLTRMKEMMAFMKSRR
jgi:hypothetical protein